MGEDQARPSTDPLRLTVPEAAELLGVTVDAIRGRIRRGTLDSERESGTVYVWVDRAEADRHEPSAASRRPSDDRTELLIAEMQDRIRSLEEANRENRRIIAMLTSRIPEIEAPRGTPSEARESPETTSEGTETRSGTQGPHAAREAPFPHEEEHPEEGLERPWWRRVFGG